MYHQFSKTFKDPEEKWSLHNQVVYSEKKMILNAADRIIYVLKI